MENGQIDTKSGPPARRAFLGSSLAMAGGLAAGYGALGAIAVRFLYSGDKIERGWMYVGQVDDLAQRKTVPFVAPDGNRIVIAYVGPGASADDFLALSSTCPHLGCQVHWEAANDRFFCPCHNGTFDPQGRPTGGPPAAAGQSLLAYPLSVEEGHLFIEVPLKRLARRAEPGGAA
jgi:Rieske Fe-S protein